MLPRQRYIYWRFTTGCLCLLLTQERGGERFWTATSAGCRLGESPQRSVGTLHQDAVDMNGYPVGMLLFGTETLGQLKVRGRRNRRTIENTRGSIKQGMLRRLRSEY
jgi:hypothetical protein